MHGSIPGVTNKKNHTHKEMEMYKAAVLQQWAERQFGMTAMAPPVSLTGIMKRQKHPASIRFRDVNNLNEDASCLLFKCQNHSCSDYCLRKRNHM